MFNISMSLGNATLASNTSLDVLGRKCVTDFGISFFYDFLQMFYILFPEKVYAKGEDVPSYEVNLIPMIGAFVVVEQIARLYQHKEFTRIQDFITNVGSAIVFVFARVLFLGSMIHVYVYLFENYRILDLAPHSIWTWIISLLLVEFVYYWTHRALHEFNILWAAHQFHHMAEDLNVTTAIRDSIVDLILYDIFPLPLAIFVPPQILVVHMQFSLIYQVWLHSSVVSELGFLEYIINTPRQHLVHHGKNPYCIDKNYGALLMIYDRMFGTYQREIKDDEIVFGVVSPTPDTFDPFVLQFGYYKDVYNKFMQMDTFGDKMSALLKGPGWSPGKPRLGLISDVPEPDRSLPKYSYDPETPSWIKLYASFHLFIMLVGLYVIGQHDLVRFSYFNASVAMAYLLLSLTSFGFLFDFKKYAPIFESLRCSLYFLFDYYLVINTPWTLNDGEKIVFHLLITTLRLFYLSSSILWLVRMFFGSYHRDYTNSKPSKQNGIHEEKKNGDSLLNDNIELAKAITQKKNGPRLSAYNLIASAAFILVGVIVLDVLYFVRVKSCNQLLNDMIKMYE